MGLQCSVDSKSCTTRRVEDLPHAGMSRCYATFTLLRHTSCSQIFLVFAYMNTKRLEQLYEGLCFDFLCARPLENSHILIQPEAPSLVAGYTAINRFYLLSGTHNGSSQAFERAHQDLHYFLRPLAQRRHARQSTSQFINLFVILPWYTLPLSNFALRQLYVPVSPTYSILRWQR
jgi:hypothetical protein